MLSAITPVFGWGMKDVELRTIFSYPLTNNHPFVETYKDQPNFGGLLTAIIIEENKNGDVFDAETLQKVGDRTLGIDLVTDVDYDQILSIAAEKAHYSEASPFGIYSQPLIGDRPPVTQSEIDELRLLINKAPNARAFLLSQDGSAGLIKTTFIECLVDCGAVFDYGQPIVEAAHALETTRDDQVKDSQQLQVNI